MADDKPALLLVGAPKAEAKPQDDRKARAEKGFAEAADAVWEASRSGLDKKAFADALRGALSYHRMLEDD